MLTKLPLLKDTCKVREQRDRKTTHKVLQKFSWRGIKPEKKKMILAIKIVSMCVCVYFFSQVADFLTERKK
jgi:type II secretory pathway component PulM